MPASFFPLRAMLAPIFALALFGRVTLAEPAPDSAYRSGLAEGALRTQTDSVRAQIEAMIAEMKANGLDTSELQLLAKASDRLGSMSQEDFKKVIAALQAASTSTTPDDRQQALATAFDTQKTIALRLKALAAFLAAQELRKGLPAKLENLIERQTANIRKTSALSDTGATPDHLDSQQKASHDIASSEQAAIESEIAMLKKALAAASAADDSDADGATEASKAELDQMNANGMTDAADKAKQLTANGPLPDAATSQQAVRDRLVDLLHLALSKTDETARLQDARSQVESLMADQKALTQAAQDGKIDGAAQADQQGRLNDRATTVQALVQPLSVPAANNVATAQQDMKQSEKMLAGGKDKTEAEPPAKQAVADLQKADALLDQQIAAVEKAQNLSPTDKLAQLQQLKSDIDQTQKSTQPTTTDLQKLQQEAVPLSPPAANKIAEAASRMQQVQPDAASANQKLVEASAEVQKEMDALAPTAQAYKGLDDASKQLAQAQQAAARAQQAMQANNFTPAAHDLTQAQQQLQQMNGTKSGAPQEAQQAIQQAQQALGDAAMQAVQAHGAEAQAQNQQGMGAMKQAQAALGQAMAQMQQAQNQGQGHGQMQAGGSQQGAQADTADTANAHGVLNGGNAGSGTGQAVGGLSAKDRDAIAQYQKEKAPPEYSAEVQQYLKNLADSVHNR